MKNIKKLFVIGLICSLILVIIILNSNKIYMGNGICIMGMI